MEKPLLAFHKNVPLFSDRGQRTKGKCIAVYHFGISGLGFVYQRSLRTLKTQHSLIDSQSDLYVV